MTPRASRGALIFYVLVLIYASLTPFFGWQLPRAYTFLTWPKYITLFDVLINVIAYAPLGGLLASLFRRQLMVLRLSRPRLLASICALLSAALLSATLEFAQSFLPDRVSTPLDILSNSSGALIGAMLVMLPLGRVFIASIVRWRVAHFAHHASTSWGILLLAFWFAAQLNPAIPFFEAGLISPTDPTNIDPALNTNISAYDPLVLLPQAVGVALNVCAFALFVSLILHPKKRVLFNIGLVLVAGLMAKLTMAALLLKAPLIAASLSPATVIGLTSGLLFFLFFSRIGYRWRAFWATLFVFAGGVMSKLTSVYSALDETLKLFNWPYGQLTNLPVSLDG
ncbi:MAG: VanZ family protein [Gammaproteobacteria bacterium]|nr:VanZ family protein [Gammaproteobacteria bacterium]